MLVSVRSLIQQTLSQARAAKGSAGENARVESFLSKIRADSPTYEPLRYVSPPLFPREQNPGGMRGSASTSGRLQDIKDLSSIVQIAEDPDKGESVELYKEHMVVINGWSGYMRLYRAEELTLLE